MAEIINATTPTIIFSFQTVDPSTIVVANLYIKCGTTDVITKDIADAEIGKDSVSWTLTQTESLLLPIGKSVAVMMDWRIADGTRGRSHVGWYLVSAPGRGEVI